MRFPNKLFPLGKTSFFLLLCFKRIPSPILFTENKIILPAEDRIIWQRKGAIPICLAEFVTTTRAKCWHWKVCASTSCERGETSTRTTSSRDWSTRSYILGTLYYRVFHLLWDLGWDDFDFSCSTVCPVLLGLMEIWQKRLCSWARWCNTQIKVKSANESPYTLQYWHNRGLSSFCAKSISEERGRATFSTTSQTMLGRSSHWRTLVEFQNSMRTQPRYLGCFQSAGRSGPRWYGITWLVTWQLIDVSKLYHMWSVANFHARRRIHANFRLNTLVIVYTLWLWWLRTWVELTLVLSIHYLLG